MVLNKDIKFLIDYENLFEDCLVDGHRFTHLWGLVKKEESVIIKVYSRLKRQFPEYYEKIMRYNVVTS
jgi:hypothetical protein